MKTPANLGKRAAATAVDLLAFCVPYLVAQSALSPDPLKIVGAFAAPAVLIAQAVLLTRRGQTFGKIYWRLRVVRRDTGENGGFVVNVLVRALAAWGPNLLLAVFGGMPLWLFADGLVLLFRKDGLSLHDLIAGTAVEEIPDFPPEPAAP